MKRLVQTATIALLALLCLAPAPAAAVDFSIFGSYLNTEDVEDAFGLGGRVAFFNRLQLQVTGTWFAAFEGQVFDSDDPFVTSFDIAPFDVGGAWYFNPDGKGFYLGGGVTYFLLKSDFGSVDDEYGFYVNIGYQFGGFMIEAVYRDAEGTITDLNDGGFEDDAKVKLTGWGLNAGWRF